MLIYLKPRTRQKLIVALALVLLVLGARIGMSIQDYEEVTAAKVPPLVQVDTNEPHVGVIVDISYPRAEKVIECLEMLESLSVKATWFASATFVESQSNLVKEIIDKGHEFGIKGTEEKPMDRLDALEIKDRITRARQAFQKYNIEPVPFFYPPLGRLSQRLLDVVFEEGYHVVKGSVDGKIMKGDEDKAGKKVADSMKPGDIFIVHVTKRSVVPKKLYLELLLKHLSDHGLSLVTLSTLVKGMR